MSPDSRKHRGPHPDDIAQFGPDALDRLRSGTGELCWLLEKGYARGAALTLVGNRHRLTRRQRAAVSRASCSDADLASRASRRLTVDGLRGTDVLIDGFNVLVTIEAALSGGVVLLCRDGSIRDLASVHGSYRRVEETVEAIEMLGRTLDSAGCGSVRWLLDRPVSNSGRIAGLLHRIGASNGWPWIPELMDDPDAILADSVGPVATSDSRILDGASSWVGLAGETIASHIPDAWMVDLRVD